MVATVHQHGSGGFGGLFAKAGPKKAAQRRTKQALDPGKKHSLARLVKYSETPAMFQQKHRWFTIKSNLRVKRSDPWRWANASSKAVAVPVQTG